MQSARVSLADEARRFADPAPASASLRMGDSPAPDGPQVPAEGALAGGHVSVAAHAQQDEECDGAKTGNRPPVMRADHTGGYTHEDTYQVLTGQIRTLQYLGMLM